MNNINVNDQTDGYVPFTEEQLILMQQSLIDEDGECMPVWLEFVNKGIKRCRLRDIIWRANNNLGDKVEKLVSDKDYYWHFEASDVDRIDRLRNWWGRGIPDSVIISQFDYWTEQEIYEKLEDWHIEEDSGRIREDATPIEGRHFTIQQEKWIANVYSNTSRDAKPYWKDGKGPTVKKMKEIIKSIYGIDIHSNTIHGIIKKYQA